MAFNLPHDMSLQQLTELQDAGSARYAAANPATTRTLEASETPAAAAAAAQAEEGGLRNMLQKPAAVERDAAAPAPDTATTESGDAKESKEERENMASDRGEDKEDKQQQQLQRGGPTWLNNAMLRQAASNYGQWLPMPGNSAQPSDTQVAAAGTDTPKGQQQQQSVEKGFLDLHTDTANSSGDLVEEDGAGGGGAGAGADARMWQNARLKADIVTHPLYEQLLAAHISCLRTATPVDQLPKIDAQVGHSNQVAAKYGILGSDQAVSSKDKDEVNEFMAHYVTLLRSFKEQLQQHVRVHAMEAVVACWELEQSLLTLTGVSPGEGTGATMSEDEDDQADSDSGYYDASLDSHDFTGFGPLIPTETERTLMERVRHELKIELKQGYKAKINDVREEILRKRRAGKLPGDTTSVLKSWWHQHSKWPYPSEDDKQRLVQETGLELKQINNWFINQRKRNWHSNPSSSASLKNKRKR